MFAFALLPLAFALTQEGAVVRRMVSEDVAMAAETPDEFSNCVGGLLGSVSPRPTDAAKDSAEFKAHGCGDAGKVIGGLAKGLQDSEMLDSFEASAGVVKLTLKQPTTYGEIATKSKVPVMWQLGQTVTFTGHQDEGDKEQFIVDVTGVGVAPPEQGVAIYEQVMAKTNNTKCTQEELDLIAADKDRDPKVLPKCIVREITAAGSHLSAYYSSIKKGQEKKIDAILRETYGSTAIRLAINAQKGQWGKVFYSMITSAPCSFETMTFSKSKPMGVKVKHVQDPNWEGQIKHQLSTKVNILAPAQLADSLKISIAGYSGIAFAESKAKSGMAFAEMMAWGNHGDIMTEVWKKDPHMAGVDEILNMLSYCPEVRGRPDETEDPSCKGGTIGRVSWAPNPSTRFL